jgi:hypothetical protein
MTKLITALLVLASAMVLPSPGRATARDYVFTVTVDVRNLHPTVTTGSVLCMVRNDMRDVAGAVVGSNSTLFTLVGGTYIGPLEVRVHTVSAPGGRGWRCVLYFILPGSTTDSASADFLSTPSTPYFRAEFERASGAPFVYQVEGLF